MNLADVRTQINNNAQQRAIELAQELYRFDEGAYLRLCERVNVTRNASPNDEYQYHDILTQVRIEQGLSI